MRDVFFVSRDSSISVSRLVHVCAMTHSCLTRDWHDSFISVTRLVHMCAMTHLCFTHDSYDSFSRVCRLIHVCAMTHSYVTRDSHASFIPATCLVHSVLSLIHVWHMIHMTPSYLRPASFMCVPWLIHMWHMTHVTVSYLWHDSLMYVLWLRDMCAMPHWRVCHDLRNRALLRHWLIHMWHDSQVVHMWHDSFLCDMTRSHDWRDRPLSTPSTSVLPASCECVVKGRGGESLFYNTGHAYVFLSALLGQS